MSTLVQDNMKQAVSEALEFVEQSRGLFTKADIPAFIAGYLACVVTKNHQEEQQ